MSINLYSKSKKLDRKFIANLEAMRALGMLSLAQLKLRQKPLRTFWEHAFILKHVLIQKPLCTFWEHAYLSDAMID
jgi:hypothetical protein